MKRAWRSGILAAIGISILVVAAVCWHSVEEIHYLKGFFPRQFSVAEASYAAWVELAKVVIIGIPFFLVIGVGLYLLRHFDKEP